MEWQRYRIVITEHAFLQALKRGIHPDKIAHTVRNGRVQRFGKFGVKFIKKDVIVVCHIAGDRIVVLTVERQRRKK